MASIGSSSSSTPSRTLQFKLVLLGETAVGKSSLVWMMCCILMQRRFFDSSKVNFQNSRYVTCRALNHA